MKRVLAIVAGTILMIASISLAGVQSDKPHQNAQVPRIEAGKEHGESSNRPDSGESNNDAVKMNRSEAMPRAGRRAIPTKHPGLSRVENYK